MCSFVLSNCYDRFNQSQSGKKKRQGNDAEVLNAKERVALTAEVLRELKSVLNTSESSLGKFEANELLIRRMIS